MRDDVDARGVEAELVAQPRGAVLGVHDDRVHPLVERALAGELAPARLARQDVVGGQHARVHAREQVARRAYCTDSHWKCTTSAARAARR